MGFDISKLLTFLKRLKQTVTALLTGKLGSLESQSSELLAKMGSLENVSSDIESKLVGLLNEMALGATKLEGIEKLIEYVSLDSYKSLMEANNGLLEVIVRSRLSLPFFKNPATDYVPRIDRLMNKVEVEREMKRLAPLNWEKYLDCLNAGAVSYEGLPPDACSTEKHPQSKLFMAFLRPYLRGHVLDVGCGPQAIPSYLAGYPKNLVHGIDPISEASNHPFDFVQGYGEFLPWEDNSFDTLISATTLDHYYLLDRGIKEAFRVLREGGHFVAWITEFSNSTAYDPYKEPITPCDAEHMFHISRTWFLPMMEKNGFIEKEVIHFNVPFNFLFMSFLKRDLERVDGLIL